MPSQLSISISKCWAFGAGRLGHQMRAVRHLVQQARHLARAGLYHDVGPAFFRHGVRAACIMCAAAQHHICGPTSELLRVALHHVHMARHHVRAARMRGPEIGPESFVRPGIIRARRNHSRCPEFCAWHHARAPLHREDRHD